MTTSMTEKTPGSQPCTDPDATQPFSPFFPEDLEIVVAAPIAETPHVIFMKRNPDIFDLKDWVNVLIQTEQPELTSPPAAIKVGVYFSPNEKNTLRSRYRPRRLLQPDQVAAAEREYTQLLHQVYQLGPEYADPINIRFLLLTSTQDNLQPDVEASVGPETAKTLLKLLWQLKHQALTLLLNDQELWGYPLEFNMIEADNDLVSLLEHDDPELLVLLQSTYTERANALTATLQGLQLLSASFKEQYEAVLFPLFDRSEQQAWVSELALVIRDLTKRELESWSNGITWPGQQPMDQLGLRIHLFDLQQHTRKFFLLNEGPFPNL